MTVFVDPRIRMRNALRSLVEADPLHWHEPSLVVFRNRLLDQTGSDARPLAELLLDRLLYLRLLYLRLSLLLNRLFHRLLHKLLLYLRLLWGLLH